MPEITVEQISAWAMLLAGSAWAVWRAVEWLRRRTSGEEAVLVTEKSCREKHAATDDRIGRIESKLDILIQDFAEFIQEFRLLQGRQEERDLQAGARPAKRSRA